MFKLYNFYLKIFVRLILTLINFSCAKAYFMQVSLNEPLAYLYYACVF